MRSLRSASTEASVSKGETLCSNHSGGIFWRPLDVWDSSFCWWGRGEVVGDQRVEYGPLVDNSDFPWEYRHFPSIKCNGRLTTEEFCCARTVENFMSGSEAPF